MASKKKDKATLVRQAAGETWEDSSLGDWDQNDFRLFAGDLGNEVTDEILYNAFAKYPSIQKTRVVRDKRSGKSKGFGFISFKNADDFVKAWREMNGKYVGNRPVKLRKSTWKDRNMETKMKKEKDRTPYTKRR
ncbi:RNA-binding domain-containing protein [Hesseltinella vesiculosa]|uniref:RNA-binding domain-containing protein n=1 Tax=Hesseltinella vesiculosa TaxID=101127 RepID=A0A1X2G3V9_9FUNG|nr:RNA-binding domain-containing protein [Hesseltinella vesiculosa]